MSELQNLLEDFTNLYESKKKSKNLKMKLIILRTEEQVFG